MKPPRIYHPGLYAIGEEITLSESAGQHLGVVLRRKPHDHVSLFSGDNYECDAEIIALHKKKVVVKILTRCAVNRESPRIIRLAQAISKGERMEWLIQKSVELGIAEIHPLIAQHGAYKLDEARLIKKHQQWQAIAIAACEQSGRNQIPLIAKPIPVTQFLQNTPSGNAYVLDPYTGKSCRDYATPEGAITLLIGPEGGLSEEELARALSLSFAPLKLGPRILRTETAAICAMSVVQAMWGDL